MTLARAVEDLYAAFAGVMRPIHIAYQAPKLTPEEARALVGTPLRELSPGLMRSYLFDAVYTVGTWDDFRFFLPRLLEVLVAEEVHLDDIANRLNYAQEHGWLLSEVQQSALHTYALAYWDDLLRRCAWYAEMLLRWGTLEPLGVQRAELLAHWRAHPAGAIALAECFILHGQLPSEWPRDEVKSWLTTSLTDVKATETLQNALLILEAMP